MNYLVEKGGKRQTDWRRQRAVNNHFQHKLEEMQIQIRKHQKEERKKSTGKVLLEVCSI
jgi:hypothetical protein